MSVEIKITDPSTTKPEELRAVITLLAAFAGNTVTGDGTGIALAAIGNDAVVTKVSEAAANRRTVGEVVARVEPVPSIAPDDSPAAGAPTAAEVFAAPASQFEAIVAGIPPVTDAAAIFGATPPNLPAAPLASVPAPVAAPAPNTNSVQLDKNGLPWDGRIHASTKTKVADGSWKMRRGVEDAEVARVEAELRQVMGTAPVPNAAASPVAPVPAAPIAAPPSPPAAPSAPNVPSPTVPGNAPVVSAATIAASAPPSSALTFPQLVPKITAAVQQGRLTQQQVLAACNANGLPSLPMLAARPDLVGAVAAALGLS